MREGNFLRKRRIYVANVTSLVQTKCELWLASVSTTACPGFQPGFEERPGAATPGASIALRKQKSPPWQRQCTRYRRRIATMDFLADYNAHLVLHHPCRRVTPKVRTLEPPTPTSPLPSPWLFFFNIFFSFVLFCFFLPLLNQQLLHVMACVPEWLVFQSAKRFSE